MSYNISFKVKVEGLENRYVSVGECIANTTWNLKDMIVKSTGLEWKNEENNGLCKDVVLHIVNGLIELMEHPRKYKKYEAKNGWGTIEDCKRFFMRIINDWTAFCESSRLKDLQDVTYFWIE